MAREPSMTPSTPAPIVPVILCGGSGTRLLGLKMLRVKTIFRTLNQRAGGAEGGLNALDFRLSIKCPLDVAMLSDRDRSHPMLANGFEGFSEEHSHAEHH